MLSLRRKVHRSNRQPTFDLAAILTQPTPRIARWILKLQEYEFEIVHRPGTSNRNADALSRLPLNALFCKSDKSVTELRERQLADFDLQVIIRALEGNFDHDPNDLSPRQRVFLSRLHEFQFQDSVLVRVIDRTWHAVRQVVVPHSIKPEILRSFHDDSPGGHLSRDKMLSKIRSRYYWLNLDADVKRHCKQCLECQKLKPCHVLPVAPMQPLQCSRPFELVSMDICGPYPI